LGNQNQQLRDLRETSDVVTVIKNSRLVWLGHVIRLVQSRVAKTTVKVR
jgi:hypothetical protein